MRIFHPLRQPPVALLWGGLSLSAIGDQLYGVALTWIATGVFGVAAGYLSALQALTILVVALLSGGWADRRDQLRFMLAADLGRAAILGVLVSIWLGTGSPNAFGLAMTVAALAVGQALFQPALQSMLPVLVADTTLLPAANGLFDGTDRSARLLGPGILALLAGTVPVVHFLSIDALSFLLSATALCVILRVYAPRTAPRPATAGGKGIGGILRGVRAMLRHPLLGYVLATAGPLNGTWYAVFFLGLPLLLKRQAVSGLGTYGLLISVYGATNLLSNIVCGSRQLPQRPQFQMFASSLLVGSGMASFALFGYLPEEWRGLHRCGGTLWCRGSVEGHPSRGAAPEPHPSSGHSRRDPCHAGREQCGDAGHDADRATSAHAFAAGPGGVRLRPGGHHRRVDRIGPALELARGTTARLMQLLRGQATPVARNDAAGLSRCAAAASPPPAATAPPSSCAATTHPPATRTWTRGSCGADARPRVPRHSPARSRAPSPGAS